MMDFQQTMKILFDLQDALPGEMFWDATSDGQVKVSFYVGVKTADTLTQAKEMFREA